MKTWLQAVTPWHHNNTVTENVLQKHSFIGLISLLKPMVQVSTNIKKLFIKYTTRSFLFGQNKYEDVCFEIIGKYYFSNFTNFIVWKGNVFERNL